MEFTPADGSINARAVCESAVNRQAHNGYILDYITRTIETPNAGFESDPEYLRDLERRVPFAGRLIAVHRLRPGSGRSQREIIGDAAFERLQDMWARDGNRCRWSVAFPIIESYEIENLPDASDVLGRTSYQRLFAHPSTLLRPLTDEDRTKLDNLTLIPSHTTNAWLAIEDEATWAASDEKLIPQRIRRDIDRDLNASAMEGLSEEQRVMVRTRAAWNAYKFVKARQRAGKLTCDDCNFDPVNRIAGTGVKPRALLDVHHREPLAEGIRYTSPTDTYFKLLCPTCHRLEHALMRLKAR